MRRPLMGIGILTISFALLAVACAPSETRLVRVVDTSGFPPSPWIGKPESLVLQTWGPNPTRSTDGSGGSILSYRGDSSVISRIPSTTPLGVNDFELGPDPLAKPFVTADSGVAARFWVNEEGRVYRVWFRSRFDWEGRHLPASETESP